MHLVMNKVCGSWKCCTLVVKRDEHLIEAYKPLISNMVESFQESTSNVDYQDLF
jgi:DNA-directed RNA polymerase specialized sigma subunit